MNGNQPIDGLSLRDATHGDLSVVKELYGQLAPDISNLDRDFPTIVSDAKATCWLLEQESTAVGMVIFSVRSTLSSGRKMVIEELVVDRHHRGRGLGSRLVQSCLDVARAQELDCVEVACPVSKPELHRFYEQAGFAHRMRYYSIIYYSEAPVDGQTASFRGV